jgi:hypothetical protein
MWPSINHPTSITVPTQVALEERGNVSWRGAYREFSARFQSAINDFHCVRTMASGLSQPERSLGAIPNTVVGRIVAAAYGDTLIPLLDDDSNDDDGGGGDASVSGALKQKTQPKLGLPHLNFRVMLRKRPLLQWELDADAFDVCRARGRRASHCVRRGVVREAGARHTARRADGAQRQGAVQAECSC